MLKLCHYNLTVTLTVVRYNQVSCFEFFPLLCIVTVVMLVPYKLCPNITYWLTGLNSVGARIVQRQSDRLMTE